MSRYLNLVGRAQRKTIPFEVLLELTHHCNFRCEHCYIPDFSVPDRLTTERILGLLDEMAEMGTLVLALSGGEMFLRKDWYQIARRARELGFELHLLTNGSRIGPDEAERIASLCCTVHVSLYTMDEEAFDRFTRRTGAFRKVVAGIEALRERDVPVVLKSPIMRTNHRDLAAVAEYAEEIGALFRTSPVVNAKKDGDLAPLRHRFSPSALPDGLGGPTIGCRPKDLDGPLCAAASRYCAITSTGDVMACPILPGSDANVRERSFRDVWENSAWLNEVRSIRIEDLHTCRSCEKIDYCGRCHAQALTEDGDLYGPSSYAKERARELEANGLVRIGGPPARAEAEAGG